ncbi:MAG: YwbE family protein [Methanoregula sp.]|nr:YwbE family protein [Methanoregula sp.]
MKTQQRSAIHAGLVVDIIQKQDQRTGKRTRGTVCEILTNSDFHPHGIKVRLNDGRVGRVAEIIGPCEDGENKTVAGDKTRETGQGR